MSHSNELIRLESELRGNTLRIYWYFLSHSNEPVGVRRVQRELGLSSPSVASHHMAKLQRLGLLENRRGEYFLIDKVKVGFLKLFIEMGGLLLPRYLFYAVFFTAMLLTYLLVYPQTLSGHNLISLMFIKS